MRLHLRAQCLGLLLRYVEAHLLDNLSDTGELSHAGPGDHRRFSSTADWKAPTAFCMSRNTA
jgi:hypothetical protein